MSEFEIVFLAAAAFLYLFSITAFFLNLKRTLILYVILPLAIAAQLASAAIRWYQAGHPPVFGTYEATLAASWFMAAATFLAVNSYRKSELLIPCMLFLALLHIVYGLTFNTAHIPLTISEQSIWVDLHALFSWLAYGAYCIAFVLSLFYLAKDRALLAGNLPSPEMLDELIFKYMTLGFIFHTTMFALGSYYSSILYGKWFVWDPVTILWLISWLFYGLIIHLRLFYGWTREKMARLVIVAMVTILAGYWSLVYIPWATYHIFDIDLKMHG
ncbi:MAG: cytochrome c biogenesis protein [Deltaproteobacteria bacterium]|nr:cytochrome c biogenesis protein [Deltaproteobacteria bacterium]